MRLKSSTYVKSVTLCGFVDAYDLLGSYCIAYEVDHGLDNRGNMVRFPVGSRELFFKASKAIGATLPPIRCEPGDRAVGACS
jgi:hypothetical protein